MVLGQVLMAQRVFLDVVKVEEAEVRGPLVVQAVRVATAARQVAVAAEVAVLTAPKLLGEWEPEEKCEYGPGSSERCWIERPGCAEA